ncbi:MAG: SAM-dependent methyltransferase [Clostridia bacterium]|nr:SAM-dependent methyltransferase [Clostridia bacterium]
MTKRLKIIASHIKSGGVFADIGCDHGYVSKYVLENNLYNKVIATDISKNSLNKAKNLLKNFGSKVVFIVSDGFQEITESVDEAVISGMGGDEISSILKKANNLPNRLVLSPQKNVKKVRDVILKLHYKILNDYTFFDKKFYDVIVAERGDDSYSEEEYIFGRDNLLFKPSDFILKLKNEEEKCLNIIKKLNLKNDNEIENYLSKIRSVLYENK